MNSRVKIALGIDISESHVSAVVLKKTAHGLKVVNGGQVPMAEGILEAGHVADSTRLKRILKTVKRRYAVRSQRVALALPVRSTLARVVELEESDPQRITRFIQDEVRQYAAFSGRETVSDHRVLSQAKVNMPGKVLVTAADREATYTLTRACESAGIAVTDVEPAVTLCAGLFNGTTAFKHLTGNRILALLKDGCLILCVFRNSVLDFVHTKSVDSAQENMAAIHAWVADEINAVIKFYGLQDTATGMSWGVVMADDEHVEVPPEAEESLKTKILIDNTVILTRWNAFQRLGITSLADEETSITAIGLAMRLLRTERENVKVNLLPENTTRARAFRCHALTAAIAFSILMLGTILVVGVLNWRVDYVNRQITALNAEEVGSGVPSLPAAVAELDIIKKQIAEASAKLDCITRMGDSRFEVDWMPLLNDISQAVPQVVRITELTSNGDSDMLIEGISKTYPAVQVFRDGLAQSAHIRHTEVKEMGMSKGDSEYVRYKILCTLVPRKTF